MGLISQSVRDAAALWKARKYESPRDDEEVEGLLRRMAEANTEEPPPKPRIRVPWAVAPAPLPAPLPAGTSFDVLSHPGIGAHEIYQSFATTGHGGFAHPVRIAMTTALGPRAFFCSSTAGTYRQSEWSFGGFSS